MEWKKLESTDELPAIKEARGSALVFKHNTTCPISKRAKRELEEGKELLKNATLYYVDILNHRDVSDALAESYGIAHQSPELLLIKDGDCVYNEALYDITAEAAANAIGKNQ